MVNQHLNRITKPKIKLQPHLALNKNFFSERTFYIKRLVEPLSLKWHLRNLFRLYGGCDMKVTVQFFIEDLWHSQTPGHSYTEERCKIY